MSAPGPARLMVGTPAYGGMVHVDYLRCLFDFMQAGIQFQMTTIGNESLITRARNAILAAFHVRPELTHLLFLDADVHLPAAGLARMLAADVPVIGAPVALKALAEDGSRIWNIGKSTGTRGKLFQVDRVGTAALLLSRDAVNALVQDAIADGRTYARASTAQGAMDAPVHYDVFQVGVVDGEYLSEDFWACRRLRALGFEVCVDPSVVTTHYGIMSA